MARPPLKIKSRAQQGFLFAEKERGGLPDVPKKELRARSRGKTDLPYKVSKSAYDLGHAHGSK